MSLRHLAQEFNPWACSHPCPSQLNLTEMGSRWAARVHPAGASLQHIGLRHRRDISCYGDTQVPPIGSCELYRMPREP